MQSERSTTELYPLRLTGGPGMLLFIAYVYTYAVAACDVTLSRDSFVAIDTYTALCCKRRVCLPALLRRIDLL